MPTTPGIVRRTLARTAAALPRSDETGRVLRAPIGAAATTLCLGGALLLAVVWAWPGEDAPVVLPAVTAAPAPRAVEPDALFDADGLLANLVVLENGVAVPVVGVNPKELVNSWGQPRQNERRHTGIDIGAPRGTPVAAALDGWVYSISNGPVGGLGLHVVDRTGSWLLYYAHLDAHAPGLYEGQAVRRGELLGYVGSTGNARGWPHLHFEVGRITRPGWISARSVNPYEFLLGRVQ